MRFEGADVFNFNAILENFKRDIEGIIFLSRKLARLDKTFYILTKQSLHLEK